MRRYILKRVLLMVPTLLGVALVVFLLMHVVPGDIALLILGAGEQGGDVNLSELAKVRHKLGLDRPLYVQFFSWVWGIVRLDFGNSLWTGAPVIEELRIRFPLTLEVAVFATLVSTLIAIPLGTLAAIRQDTWEDYIRTAWAKGLREFLVVVKHTLKNAMLPVITIIGAELAFLMGGLVVTETVFTLNGLGRFIVDAILRRDIPVVQTMVLMTAFIIIFVNLIVDLLYAWLDPRISYGAHRAGQR